MKRDKEHNDAELGAWLTAYLDDELDEAQTAELAERIAYDRYAQDLLAELADTAQAVRSLPHEPAPAELAELVRDQLERAALLGDAGPVGGGRGGADDAETAGRNHLFLRRFLAAAAMLLLAGAVALIVYRVLVTPAPVAQESQPLVTQGPDEPEDPFLAMANRSDEFPAEPEPQPFEPIAPAQYGAIHLVLHPDDSSPVARLGIEPGINLIDTALNNLGIEQTVRTELPDQARQYAFLLPIDQLEPLLAALRPLGTLNLRLARDSGSLEVQHAPTELIIAVAREPVDPQRLVATLAPGTDQAVEHVTPADVPTWLGQALARGEVEFPDLELLGPEELAPPTETPAESTWAANQPSQSPTKPQAAQPAPPIQVSATAVVITLMPAPVPTDDISQTNLPPIPGARTNPVPELSPQPLSLDPNAATWQSPLQLWWESAPSPASNDMP